MIKRLLFILIILSNTCFSQETTDTVRILAQQIAPGEGSKIHIAKYRVLKVLEGKLNTSVISVGYADYLGMNHTTESVLLTLVKYKGNTSIKDYYHYPNYNALEGAEVVNLFRIDRAYWEGCETGEGACAPLTFYKDSKLKKTFLLMPCGGTSTTVSLSDKKEIRLMHTFNVANCPPMFELTKLAERNYNVSMLSCGLGGSVPFSLKTKQ